MATATIELTTHVLDRDEWPEAATEAPEGVTVYTVEAVSASAFSAPFGYLVSWSDEEAVVDPTQFSAANLHGRFVAECGTREEAVSALALHVLRNG